MEREPYDSGDWLASWAAIRKHCERGDESKAFDACITAGIDPRAVRLFVIASAYAKEAGEIQKAAEGAEAIKREAAEFISVLKAARAVNLADAKKLRDERTATQQRHDQALFAIENARMASIRLRGLQERLPGLFGLDRQMPIVGEAPLAYRAELERLSLPDTVDPWQHLQVLRAVVAPSKKYTTAETFSQVRVS